MIPIFSDRKAVHVAILFLLGILASKSGNLFVLAGAFLLPIMLFFYRKSKKTLIYCAVLFLVFLAGFFRYRAEEAATDRIRSAFPDGSYVTVSGRVIQIDEKEERTQYTLDRVSAKGEGAVCSCRKILLSLSEGAAKAGEIVVASGKVFLPEPASNFGNFDQKEWYDGTGLDFFVYGDRLMGVYPSKSPLLTALSGVREALSEVYRHFLPEKEASLMDTMLLGKKAGLDPEIKELYRASGLSHILAISGLHISMIGVLLYRILRKRKIPFLPAAVGGATLIILYAFMAGMSASAFRASLMFALSLFAPPLKRSYDSLTALAISALVLAMQNPNIIFYSGFIFSFMAVISVVVFGQAWNRSIEERRKERRKPCKMEDPPKWKLWIARKMTDFRRTLVSAAAVQLVTLPLVMAFYYEIPVYGLFINLLLLPLAGCILIFGFLGGALGILSLYAGLLPEWPVQTVLLIPKLIYSLYERVCLWAERLPFSQIVTGKPEIAFLVLYFLILSLLFLFLSSKGKPVLGVLGLPLLATLGLSKRPGRFELSLLDVGQGDGIYLSSETGATAFVDGGSSSEEQVGKYRIFPFLKASGVSAVDYWFVSHTDSDHISGLSEALAGGFEVKNLVFSTEIYRDETLEKLEEAAEAAGTKVSFLKPGGALHMGDTTVTNLFPTTDYQKEDKNAMSMVLLVEKGTFHALLTGDTTAEEEEVMVNSLNLPEIGFLKAAHHGSRYSNSADFLRLLSPEAAGISCGKNNRYGHPGKEAVENMEAAGAKIYDTRFDGQITVTLQDEEMVVETMK